MRKWWWWWLPGWHKKWKLDKRRVDALSDIIGERLQVEVMAQRPRSAEDIIDTELLKKVVARISEIEVSAKSATNTDDLDDLTYDAEGQGEFRAYLCPLAEIRDEGELVFDLIEEWGVPKTKIKRLQDLLGSQLQKAETKPEAARSALRSLFQEKNSWGDYTDEYEKTMRNYTRWLFAITIALLLLAVFAFRFAFCHFVP